MPDYPVFPIPPGTPEARAAVERVKQRLAEETRLLSKFTLPGSPRRRSGTARFCPVCRCIVRTPGETHCHRHRERRPRH